MRKLILYLFIMLVGLPNALTRGVFAMEAGTAEMYLPIVHAYLTKERATETPHTPGYSDQGYVQAFAIDPKTGEKYRLTREWNEKGSVFDFIGAPKGSVAVIPITDAITKYDYCGMYGTMSLTEILNLVNRNENLVGAILDMDTPGGEVYGTKSLSDAVGNSRKPVVTHVSDGYCASAGMYIACKSKKILMAQPTDKVGSIGVYTTLIDAKGAYEKLGYKVVTVYSPTSPEKNQEWRDAMEKGKVEAMEKQLAFIDKVFMDQVRQGRGAKLNEDALKGGMYFTDEAIEMGLCDGYATFEQAVEEVINLGKRPLLI